MTETPRWHLERYLPLLRLQAQQVRLHPRVRRRFDESDLVSETVVKAQKKLYQCRATTEAEFIAWLRRILANTLADMVDHETRPGNNVFVEIVEESSRVLDGWLAGKEPTPSQQLQNQELLLRIAEAIQQLPDDQRDVVILRDLHETPVRQIAEQLGRTEKAVAGLLLRGRRRLRELLADYQ